MKIILMVLILIVDLIASDTFCSKVVKIPKYMYTKKGAHKNWSVVIPEKAAPVTQSTLMDVALCRQTLGSEHHRYAIG